MNKKNFLLPALFILLFGCAFASTVTRSFSATTVRPGADLTVTLTVDITAAETYYAIDEVFPSGWIVKPGSTTGSAEHAGHLKWVVTEGAVNTTYTYVLTAPNQSGTANFSGIFMFEEMGSETAIGGQTQVTVGCTIDDDCQINQLCCRNVCVTPCSADSDCAAGRVCINPNECNAACAITGCTADSQCPSGQICCNPNCVTPGCIDDSGCNDNDEKTADKCNNVNTCTAKCTHEPIVIKPPIVIFEPIIETDQTQLITLTAGDGTPIRDFNVLITFPDKTTAKFTAISGVVTIPIGAAGTFNGTVQTAGHDVPFSFEARVPIVIIPDEVDNPNYLFIWLLAIVIIAGLLMAITRLKPLWFRVFMAISYTALPVSVRYYLQSMEIAFAVIAIQTTVLTALWFRQWKKEKLGQKKEQVEWKQTAKKETGAEKEPWQSSSGETTEKGWSELQRELDRITEEKKEQAAGEEKSADEGDWDEFTK